VPDPSTIYLGGITCSGKTTVAGLLAQRHGFVHYKTDDTFDPHARAADREHQPTMWTYQNNDETWTRWFRQQGVARAAILHRFYAERFPMILSDLTAIEGPVVADGVDLLPEKVLEITDARHAAWLIPSRDFVNQHYTEREWADHPPTSDEWKYYQYFIRNIQKQAKARDLKVIHVDGSVPPREIVAELAEHFNLIPTTPTEVPR